MSSRDQIQVTKLTPTPEKMKAAMERAVKNAKSWVEWRDQGPINTGASNAQEGE